MPDQIFSKSLFDYGMKVFKHNKFGYDTKDNGVLICFYHDTLKHRVEARILPGYGLEGALTDAACGRIIRDEHSKDINESALNITSKVLSAVAPEYTQTSLGPTDRTTLFVVLCIVITLLLLLFPSGLAALLGATAGGILTYLLLHPVTIWVLAAILIGAIVGYLGRTIAKGMSENSDWELPTIGAAFMTKTVNIDGISVKVKYFHFHYFCSLNVILV